MSEHINQWGSHIGLLYYSILSTRGTIVELGTGLISTPFLHAACCMKGIDRKVVSFECMHTWFNHFHGIANENHEIYHDVHDQEVFKYERYDWSLERVSVVLVDGGPPITAEYFTEGYTNRFRAVKFFKNVGAEIIIVHDTEDPRMYAVKGWKELVESFKYCATDKKCESGWTTALSDVFDVEKDLMPRLSLRKPQKECVQ